MTNDITSIADLQRMKAATHTVAKKNITPCHIGSDAANATSPDQPLKCHEERAHTASKIMAGLRLHEAPGEDDSKLRVSQLLAMLSY